MFVWRAFTYCRHYIPDLAGKGPVRFQSHFLFSTLVIIITKDTLPSAIVFHSGGVDVQ